MASSTRPGRLIFSGSLSNRIYYFFRKHADGKVVVAVAEWPGTIQDGVLIAGAKSRRGQHDHRHAQSPSSGRCSLGRR
jgi:hypothetical protein